MSLPIVTVEKAQSLYHQRLIDSVHLLHFARLQATRANTHRSNAAFVHDLCALQIRLPAPFCLIVRVTDVVADHRLFPANIANPCQRGHLRINLYISNALCYTRPIR